MINRRSLLCGIAAVPMASVIPQKTNIIPPKIDLPLVYGESTAFCQTHKMKFGELFFELISNYKVYDSDPNSKFPEMSFEIDKQYIPNYNKLIESSYDTPYDIIKQCPIREIKNTKENLKFEINKLGTEIAKKTRRGIGKNILCHPKKLEYVKSLNFDNKIISVYSELKEDEYVCLYNSMHHNTNKPWVDGAIYKMCFNDHEPRYIPNLYFKDYIIRFKINEVL